MSQSCAATVDSIFDDDHDEFSKLVHDIMDAKTTASTSSAAAAIVKEDGNKTVSKFEQRKCSQIYQQWVDEWRLRGHCLNFSNIGCWALFYDEKNLAAAWKTMTELYTSRELFGVVKIANPHAKSVNGRGFPVYAFTGPASQKHFVEEVGRRLLQSMAYTQQKSGKKFNRNQCSLFFPKKVYFKTSKMGLCLYEMCHK